MCNTSTTEVQFLSTAAILQCNKVINDSMKYKYARAKSSEKKSTNCLGTPLSEADKKNDYKAENCSRSLVTAGHRERKRVLE